MCRSASNPPSRPAAQPPAPTRAAPQAIWAAVVLVVYLTTDPRGRPLLAEAGLTDLDVQIACTLETYGRAEITRRVHLRQKQDGELEEDELEIEEETEGEEGEEGRAARGRRLATKRKRASKSAVNTSSSDSHGVLAWWFDGLRCEDTSVVQTLVSNTKSSAREAAQATLERQAEGSSVASNRCIQQLSAHNAVRSAEAMVPLVSRRAAGVPCVVAWRAEGGHGVGFSRHRDAGTCTVLHALRAVKPALWPRGARIAVLHSTASQELATSLGSEARAVLPLVCEAHGELARLRAAGRRKGRAAAQLERHLSAHARRPLPSVATALTRSVLVLRTWISVHARTHAGAAQLAAEANALLRAVEAGAQAPRFACDVLTGVSQEVGARLEPLCMPCPRFGVSIRVSELLRRWMIGRTRKNEPVKIPIGTPAPESPRENPPVSPTGARAHAHAHRRDAQARRRRRARRAAVPVRHSSLCVPRGCRTRRGRADAS